MARRKKTTWTPTVETWTQFGLPAPESEVNFHPDRKWRIDFVWQTRRGPLAVEIHGGIWFGGAHSRGSSQANDFTKGQHCTLRGFWRMEFTPKQVKTGYAAEVVRAFMDGEANPVLPVDPEDRRKSVKKQQKEKKNDGILQKTA